MKNGVLSNFTRSHISSDRGRSGYEINSPFTTTPSFTEPCWPIDQRWQLHSGSPLNECSFWFCPKWKSRMLNSNVQSRDIQPCFAGSFLLSLKLGANAMRRQLELSGDKENGTYTLRAWTCLHHLLSRTERVNLFFVMITKFCERHLYSWQSHD